ncbi:MAG: ribonuclease P protein subunit [Candidatus Nanohaloarchaeota archaeon QJJ-9]|nr:ribonuclease P protein subunit [Candidatus Nanohaloarchaeota archaeon QJJ-9]
MPREPENLPRHELIGLKTEVVESSDPEKEGIEGKVVDETEGILIIGRKDSRAKIPKEESVFRFYLGDKKVKVNGKLLEGKPEERISKRLPPKWGYVKER